METRDDLASSLPRQQIAFFYDADGRRIGKEVSNWDATSETFITSTVTRSLYNDWNLLAEINETGAITHSYLWGISENGRYETTVTPGALVGLRDHSDDLFYFAQSDGNGNIAALIASPNGEVVARYEYGPFGETIQAIGPMATKNPLQFSSKYLDIETKLYNYGFRLYNPELGRWLNRDPIGETGGLNLYGFVENDPVNWWDLLGLSRCDDIKKRIGDLQSEINSVTGGIHVLENMHATGKTLKEAGGKIRGTPTQGGDTQRLDDFENDLWQTSLSIFEHVSFQFWGNVFGGGNFWSEWAGAELNRHSRFLNRLNNEMSKLLDARDKLIDNKECCEKKDN
jgi:RHS repeat-associated protein